MGTKGIKGIHLPPWTDELVAQAVKFIRDEGLSYAKAAAALGHGLTRNAVVSKMKRLGYGTLGPRTRPPRHVKPASQLAFKPKSVAPAAAHAYASVEARDLASDESDCAVTLLQLKSEHCRWPLGDPPRSRLPLLRRAQGRDLAVLRAAPCPRHDPLDVSRMTHATAFIFGVLTGWFLLLLAIGLFG